jgi:regulator of CtrA degradation
MRLTTRLLDLASWLLIRRAIKEGEMSEAEAQKKRKSVTLQGTAKASHVQGLATLPSGLKDLIEESYALNERIVRLDRALSVKVDDVGSEEPVLANPVGMQMDRLRVAFGS